MYILPAEGYRVSSTWQQHKDRTPPSAEPGTDYATPMNTPLRAIGNGVVVGISTSNSGAAGRFVRVNLDDGRAFRFLHLASVSVRTGQRVTRGQVIARSGASGFGNDRHYGSHVHVTLWAAHGMAYKDTIDFERYVGGLEPNQRVVSSNILNRRRTPDRKSAPLSNPLRKGTIGNFVGWRRGETVNGNNVWFQGISGDWFHSGGLEGGARTTGLKDLNPASTATRRVKTLRGSTHINGRSAPRTSAAVKQKIQRGNLATFNGWRRGEKVTQNGVTSDIWFRGAFNGNWFWAGNFTSRSTSGLPQV